MDRRWVNRRWVTGAVACLAGILPAVGVLAQGAPAKKKWTCTAPGLVTASYDGGHSAYVHLEGFSQGGVYAVSLNSARTAATGVTANGTRFVCKAL